MRLGIAVVMYELSDFRGQRRLEVHLHCVSSCTIPHGLMHGSWSMTDQWLRHLKFSLL